MNFHCSGLKCDAKGCDYRDMSVKFEDYPKWINRPCPKCGAPLLTQADYDTVAALHSMATNPVFNAIEKMIGRGGPKAQMKVELDGSGKPDIKIFEEIKKEDET
jgi:hypothetical protein